MNPDVFNPIPVPDALTPYVRRVLVAFQTHPVAFDFVIRATGYCYLGWTPRGRWYGHVNGAIEYDTDVHGPLHLSGQIKDSEVVCGVSGPLGQAFAELSAVGQYALFGIPGEETVERALPPPNAVRAGLPKDIRSSAALAENFFAYLSGIAERARPVDPAVTQAVDLFEQSNGAAPVATVAEQTGISERQLHRTFTRIVGLSPKSFGRTLQVNAALNGLLALGEERLSELAATHGYADQAHMTRSFVQFLGESPVALSDGIEPTLAKFVGQSRQGS